MASQRPNILLIMDDQHRWNYIDVGTAGAGVSGAGP
jgi:hypothetical protein